MPRRLATGLDGVRRWRRGEGARAQVQGLRRGETLQGRRGRGGLRRSGAHTVSIPAVQPAQGKIGGVHEDVQASAKRAGCAPPPS